MSDDEEDPIEDLSDAVDEREGDPFDRLDPEEVEETAAPYEVDEDETSQPEADEREWRPPDPDADAGAGARTGPGSDSDPEPGDDPIPGADPGPAAGPESGSEPERATDVSQPTESTRSGSDSTIPPEKRLGDPFESPESAFQRMEVGDVDPDVVWNQLSDAQARGSVSDRRERTYAEVSKHSYCERCEFFTGPPEVGCTHEGTEILEFLDMDKVRVVDCPIVAEREALEREE